MGKEGLVGVDVGRYYTKVVSLSNKKGIIYLERAFKENTPTDVISSEGINEIILGDFLHSIFYDHKVRNKAVAVSLNSSFVITKTLSMPLVADEEIEQAVMWEAEQYAPVDMEQVNVSYQILNKDHNKNEMIVLLALTKKEIVDSYIKAFKKAKLDVRVVDVDVFSIYNAYEANDSEVSNKHLAFIDVGYASTKLLFVKKGMPTFTRYMEFNLSSVLEEAREVLNYKKEEVELLLQNNQMNDKKEALINFINDRLVTLYTQISNSITFYENNILNVEEPIETIVLSGVIGALYEHLNVEMMQEMLKSNVVRFNPFNIVSKEGSGIAIDETTPDISPFYCVAAGLSLRGVLK